MLDGNVLVPVQWKYKFFKEVRSFHLLKTTKKIKVSAYVLRKKAKTEDLGFNALTSLYFLVWSY